MIVCLGWGSLIWDHRNLPTGGQWRNDGPALPVEFARQSKDGRMTLVIADKSEPIPVLWTRLELNRLDDARHALAHREGISFANFDVSVGYWSETLQSTHTQAGPIGKWAGNVGASAVVWTALKPRFGGESITPSCKQVVSHLSELDGNARRRAEEYVRRAPAQISTHYRDAIEQELGWTVQAA